MRKLIKSIILVMLIVFAMSVVACDFSFGTNNKDKDTSGNGSTNEKVEETYGVFKVSGSKITGLKNIYTTEIIIPKEINGTTITSIDDYAFNKTSLEKVSFESGSQIATIGEGAFRLTFLTEIVLPDTVETVGPDAFAINNLKKVELNEGCKSIGSGAFSNSGLEEVVIPKSLTFLGKGAFGSCDNLKSITFKDTEGWYKIVTSNYENDKQVKIDVSNSKTNATQLVENSWGAWKYNDLIKK